MSNIVRGGKKRKRGKKWKEEEGGRTCLGHDGALLHLVETEGEGGDEVCETHCPGKVLLLRLGNEVKWLGIGVMKEEGKREIHQLGHVLHRVTKGGGLLALQ